MKRICALVGLVAGLVLTLLALRTPCSDPMHEDPVQDAKPRDTAIDWERAQANQTRTLCGKCGHGMHWRECDWGGCLCRNDISEWSAV